MHRNSTDVSTKQQRVATLAEQSAEMGFTSLAYLMDIDWLREAYRQTRKTGAVGVDGQTAADYEADLEANLRCLLDRAKSGAYWAPPVRRVHIPKGGSGNETRAIGIPTLEDKILQRAVVMLLAPIYEHDFLDCSHGYRPGRSAHTALQSLWQQAMASQGGWILEVDIRKFFDTLDHTHLRTFVRHRVRDGVLLRLIGKWLKAGVMEEGQLTYPEAGSPQGGVISPLLANVYLHYVLDAWFEAEVQPRLRGKAYLIRYADDLVIGFTDRTDAQRVQEVLPKRFGRYGLALHPDKTRLVGFQRGAAAGPKDGGSAGECTGSFDFLGFTHLWARSRRGRWYVRRKTASSRFRRGMQAINRWCRRHRHLPVAEQQAALSQKLRGHYAYFGITGNSPSLSRYARRVTRLWRKWLSRRRRGYRMPWVRFQQRLERFPLPPPRAVHSVCARAASP